MINVVKFVWEILEIWVVARSRKFGIDALFIFLVSMRKMSTSSSPSPNSSPSLPNRLDSNRAPPPSTTPPSQLNSSASSPLPPPLTSVPPTHVAPPPQSSLPTVPATSPPPPPSVPPQPNSPPPSPPSPPAAPPPSPPLASPPSPISSPPPSSPSTPLSPPPASPSPPTLLPPPTSSTSPPVASSPPPALSAPPPPPQPSSAVSSPPSASRSPPSPQATSPPSANSPPPPRAEPPQGSPPTPAAVTSSPPPPVVVAEPPSSKSPPLPRASPPQASSPPNLTPPPSISQSAPPSAVNTPPSTTLPSPPPSAASSFLPPPSAPPAPTGNSSATGGPPPSVMPSIPAEKPTAKPTEGSAVPVNSPTRRGGLNSGGVVAIGVAVGFVVLTFFALAAFFVQKRKKRRPKLNQGYAAAAPFGSPHNSDSYLLKPPATLELNGSSNDYIRSPSEQGGLGNSNSWFTYEELAQATDWFALENVLGEGGFGKVYKGILADGREVAVKQLKVGGGQGEREFRAEVEIISRIHHRYLVSLVGYCISENHRLLVYDYVPNDTLHYHLHGEDRPVMEWAIRVKVAAGAARGIAYLHEDCNPRIIHRDIKSSNILLDNNFDARVSDFGLAKLAMDLDSKTHVSTRVMGTFGYMAPEYATSGKLTEKSDVFSFGVVLLELITGCKPIDDSQPMGDESLVERSRPLLAKALESQDFDELVDPRLEKNYVESEMFRMIEAAAACVRHQAARRPRMSQVVRALDSLGEESDLSNGMKFGQSEVFDSTEHSAQIRMFQRIAFGSQDYSSSLSNYSSG